MKILFCEVENYGKISGRKIVFDGNLPQFCEDNGKGKTTLCSFLRVMFYGMETRREKDVVFGDREHFYPFSGGRFGGSVTFLYGGKPAVSNAFSMKNPPRKIPSAISRTTK